MPDQSVTDGNADPQDPKRAQSTSRKLQTWRRAVLLVALLNLAHFVIEFAVARVIGSVSLVADSVDFLEDGALNLLIFFAAVWSVRRRATVGHALVVNLTCAAILARHRRIGGSLAKAAWLSARNDSLANVAILVAAAVTLQWASAWPDIVVGLGIGAVNADAGVKVCRAASKERLEARFAQP